MGVICYELAPIEFVDNDDLNPPASFPLSHRAVQMHQQDGLSELGLIAERTPGYRLRSWVLIRKRML